MISFCKLNIVELEDYDKLLYIYKLDIKKENIENIQRCIDDKVVEKFKNYLGLKCDTLLLEFPYYDSDYLSTYYLHYSTKLTVFSKWCVRVHIIKENNYYGYIVLRPITKGFKYGKTYIAPKLLINDKAWLITMKAKVHIVGNEIIVPCFPWASQHTDVAVCAHEATWTVLKYFGNRFSNYANTTIGEVISMVRHVGGREIPSDGLTPAEVCELLKSYHFSPVVIKRNAYKFDEDFLDEVYSYVQSGLPVIAFLYPMKHAISIIGHGKCEYNAVQADGVFKKQIYAQSEAVNEGHLIEYFYAMDDNAFPYRKLPIFLPKSGDDLKYAFSEVKYVVVPLYQRMQLDYRQVRIRMEQLIEEGLWKWPKPLLYSIYMTSSNSIKEEALNSFDMDDKLVDIIVNLTMSRFVWCIDIIDLDDKSKIFGRVLIDSTAPTYEENPFLLIHDGNHIQYNDIQYNGVVAYKLRRGIKPYNRHKYNLKEYNPD